MNIGIYDTQVLSDTINRHATLDRIPFVATFTNTTHLFYKLFGLPQVDSLNQRKDDKGQRLCSDRLTYYIYLHNKSLMRCIALLIPGLGQFVVYFLDRSIDDPIRMKCMLERGGIDELWRIGPTLKNNAELFLTLIKNNHPDNIRKIVAYAGNDLKTNIAVLNKLFYKNSLIAMEFASPETLKNATNINRILNNNNPNPYDYTIVMTHISDDLKSDADSIHTLTKYQHPRLNPSWPGTIDQSLTPENLFIIMSHISNKLIDDSNFMLKVLDYNFTQSTCRDDPDMLGIMEYPSARLRDDPDFMEQAIAYNPSSIEYASKELKSNADFIEKMIRFYPAHIDVILSSASKSVKSFEFLTMILDEYPDELDSVLRYADPTGKGNSPFLLDLMSRFLDYPAFETILNWTDPELSRNEGFIRDVISTCSQYNRQNAVFHSLLQWTHESLLDDAGFIRRMLEQTTETTIIWNIMDHTSTRLKNSPVFFHTLIQDHPENLSHILGRASSSLKCDATFIAQVAENHPQFIRGIIRSSHLTNNAVFIGQMIETYPNSVEGILREAHHEIKDDPGFMMPLIDAHPNLFPIAGPGVRQGHALEQVAT